MALITQVLTLGCATSDRTDVGSVAPLGPDAGASADASSDTGAAGGHDADAAEAGDVAAVDADTGGSDASDAGDGATCSESKWQPIPAVDKIQSERVYAAFASTGDALFVYGGGRSTIGMKYQFADGVVVGPGPTVKVTGSAPGQREGATAVAAGGQILLWGGNVDNAQDAVFHYDMASGAWTSFASGKAPPIRHAHSAIWTGTEMIVWGGVGSSPSSAAALLGDGASYDPTSQSWKMISATDAPQARRRHAAAWTGSKMLVWGGVDGAGALRTDGAAYDPATDSWAAMAPSGLSGRSDFSAVWTGSTWLIFGGTAKPDSPYAWLGSPHLGDGASYDPAANSWSPIPPSPVVGARAGHVAVWVKGKMLVWGGVDDAGATLESGALYDPSTQTWTAVSTCGSAYPTVAGAIGLVGDRVAIWGGFAGQTGVAGGLFSPD